jgi:type I restriction enzyme M protein
MPHRRIGQLSSGCLKGRNVPYREDGDFPVIRSGNISETFDPSTLLKSSASSEAFYLRKKDILISSIGQGSIGKIQLFREDGLFAAVSEVTVVRQERSSPACLAAFLAGRYGQAQLHRFVTGATGQLHLYPKDVDNVLVPDFDPAFAELVDELYAEQIEGHRTFLSSQQEAERILFDGLGLGTWNPPSARTFAARASAAGAAKRLDAQYFRPLFTEVEAQIRLHGDCYTLGEILLENSRGRQPAYAATGLPVINSKHVRTNRVIVSANRFATAESGSIVIKEGDVLLNGTGVGTIGRAAAYLHSADALPDNHVTVLRTSELDPVYLAVFLNSALGQWQVARHTKGSSGQVELYPSDIDQFLIWKAPISVQARTRQAVLSAFQEEHRSQSRLRTARRAVEIFVEEGQEPAMRYIADYRRSL